MPTTPEVPKPEKKTPLRKTPTLAEKAAAKASILAAATDVLSNRVVALTDIVAENNNKIDYLSSEVNKKPDDIEVQFIAGMAGEHRRNMQRNAIASGILAAIVAGGVAFTVADYKGHERCKINQQNIATLVRLLESVPDPDQLFVATIDDLKSNRNEC
jgi:hypothetical protein